MTKLRFLRKMESFTQCLLINQQFVNQIIKLSLQCVGTSTSTFRFEDTTYYLCPWVFLVTSTYTYGYVVTTTYTYGYVVTTTFTYWHDNDHLFYPRGVAVVAARLGWCCKACCCRHTPSIAGRRNILQKTF